MSLTASGMRVLMRQLTEVRSKPLDSIQVHASEDLSELRFDIDGPEGTPFSEGRFHVALVFDEHYPEVPPKGYFRTKIFHPNVSDRGEICVNALKKDWNPQLGLPHILLVIRCLLVEPNPESALNEEAGRLLLQDYASYERKARMLTSIHAKRPAGVARITHPDSVKSTSLASATTPYSALSGGGSGCNAGSAAQGAAEAADKKASEPRASREDWEKVVSPKAHTGLPQNLAGTSSTDLNEASTDFSHPLRSLEGNNAHFMSGKVRDDDAKAVSVNAMVRGSGEHGVAGSNANPIMVDLLSAKAAQKKTTDKKKAALRRI